MRKCQASMNAGAETRTMESSAASLVPSVALHSTFNIALIRLQFRKHYGLNIQRSLFGWHVLGSGSRFTQRSEIGGERGLLRHIDWMKALMQRRPLGVQTRNCRNHKYDSIGCATSAIPCCCQRTANLSERVHSAS